MTARLQLRCPAGFHRIFNMQKKNTTKSFSSLGQKTPEAARVAKNSVFQNEDKTTEKPRAERENIE